MAGVMFASPPDKLIPDISASIASAIAKLPPGSTGAIVGVATQAGVNAAIVVKAGEDWAIQAWIGKTWAGPLEAGASVLKTW